MDQGPCRPCSHRSAAADPEGPALIFRLFSQSWIRYGASPAVSNHGFDGGLRPGDRAPHGVFTVRRDGGPRGVFDMMHGLRHDVLMFEGPESQPAMGAHRRAVAEALGRYGLDIAIHVIPTPERELHRIYGATRPRVFLIRPDGHVSHAGPLADLDALAAHMDRLYHRTPSSTGRA